MKELKISRAIKCLYVVAGVQILSSVYSAYASYKISQSNIELNKLYPEMASNLSDLSYNGTATMWSVVVIVATYFIIQDLKKERWWAWLGALCVLLISAPSFALPASIIGLISLLDEDVRSGFLTQLDIKV